MLEIAVVAGMAAFALTSAVVSTDMFQWFRDIGTWAETQRLWVYILCTPARASVSGCPTCFSLWAAMPISAWAGYLTDWWHIPLLWLCSAGLSVMLYEINYRIAMDRDDPDELKRLVEDNLGKEEPDTLSDFTTAEACSQTADEQP